MAKYVPPFKKEKVFSEESRWSQLREPEKQERPERFQRQEKPHDRYIAAKTEPIIVDDFPSLARKPVKASSVAASSAASSAVSVVSAAAAKVEPGAIPKGRMTYASLAANWAEQVKEKEEKARKEAEEEAERQRVIAKLNEVKIVRVGKGVIAKKRVDSDDDKEVDIGCHTSDHSEYSDGPDNYDVIVDAESESEEEEEDPDAFWTQRKNRNEIY
jgi:hypothetical protein